MDKDARIFVAGHRGLVGSAIVRALERRGATTIMTRTRAELDLTDRDAVMTFFKSRQPHTVYLAAAKVGGILANDTFSADFIRENLLIQTSVIHAAYATGTKKLVFLGSSCIYPKHAPQPMREDALLTGPLEPTNEAYAIAKIAGIKMAQAYRKQYGFDAISLMPTNLYGPNDNFDLTSSHVLPALIRKFHEARVSGAPSVTLWGTGTPRREFLHVDDLAEACLFLADHYSSGEVVNVGVGEDLTIRELAETIQRVVGFQGELVFDTSKPDGTPRKLLDVSRLHALGFKAKIPLEEGIRRTYAWYLEQPAR
ncbi:MAG: GDP-L-fucose synthase [Polyangiaceae bacterium]